MRKITFVVLLMAFFYNSVFSQLRTNFEKNIFLSGKEQMPYRFMKPAQIKDSTLYPLVLFLHSEILAGSDNEKQLNHYILELAKNTKKLKYPSFVLAPQIEKGRSWSSAKMNGTDIVFNTLLTKEMRLAWELLNKTIAAFPIDTNRIYLIGISDGALGAYELINYYPQKVAAVLSICGSASLSELNPKAYTTPFWALCGVDDIIYSPKNLKEVVFKMNEMGGSAKLTLLKNTNHICWDEVAKMPETLSWLFMQSK
jgi:predicted peptidase